MSYWDSVSRADHTYTITIRSRKTVQPKNISQACDKTKSVSRYNSYLSTDILILASKHRRFRVVSSQVHSFLSWTAFLNPIVPYTYIIHIMHMYILYRVPTFARLVTCDTGCLYRVSAVYRCPIMPPAPGLEALEADGGGIDVFQPVVTRAWRTLSLAPALIHGQYHAYL